ncbi:MAG TPA: PAS domain-containing protein, partial [Paludibacter sp.]|nr:PAS domain-containing protein [Paludibacter sp.]
KNESERHSQLMQAYMDQLPYPATIVDLNGTLLMAGKSLLDFWNVTPEKAVGMSLSELVTDKQYAAQLQQDIQEILKFKEAIEHETTFTLPGKKQQTFITTLFPLMNKDGCLTAIGVLRVDITNRKKLEKERSKWMLEAMQSQDLLRSVIDNVPIPIFYKDINGVYKFLNQAFCEVHGRNEKELIGKTLSELTVSKRIADKCNQMDIDLYRDRVIQRYECKMKYADKSEHDIIFNKSPFYDSYGNLLGLVGAMFDITELKKAERELWQNRQLLQNVMDNIPQSIFWKDAGSVFMGCNRAFAEDAGLSSPADIVGKTDYDMPWAEQAELYTTDDRQVLESGEPKLGYEEPLVTADGSRIWLNTNKVPLRDKDGKVYAVLGTFEDVTERKLREQQLEETRKQIADAWQLLQDFMDNIPYEIVMLDLEERIVIINHAFAGTLNSTREELIGKYYPDFVDAQLRDIAINSNKEVIEKKQQLTLREQILTDSGELNHILTVKFPVYNSEGIFLYIGIVDADITMSVNRENELQRAKEEIEKSRQFLQAFMDNASAAMFAKDISSGEYILRNRMKNIYQHKGKLLRFFPENGRKKDYLPEESRFDDIQVMKGGKPLEFFDIIENENGTEEYYKTLKFPIYDKQGTPMAVGAITNDITDMINRENELVRMQDEIEKSRQFLQAFMDNASTSMFAKNKDGQYLMVNKKKIEYLPLQKPLIGHTEEEALEDPTRITSFRKEDAQVIACGHPMEFFDTVTRENGITEHYKTIKFPILDKQGNFLAVGGITTDITDIIMRENELTDAKNRAEEAASAQERFLAAMSHDMRTPLNGIVGMINLLGQTPLTPEQQEYMDAMRVSSTNLRVLINDILDISKIQAGKLNIESVLFDLEELLDSVEEVFKHEARKKQLEFSITIERGLPTMLEGDPTRLSQILNNLIGNAMKFTATGFVRLDIRHKELTSNKVQLIFAIEDSGIGISSEGLSRLFQPFSQAGSDTTRKFGGSGLGLSICKSLVELQGGEIGVSSEPGKGSTFCFSIPYSKAGQQPKLKEKHKRQEAVDSGFFRQFAGLKCLIVEDNLINQKVAFHTLKKNGIVTDIANNGHEAIDILKEHRGKYDFILMDIQMPEMDGYQATTAIRDELNLEIPIIAMTASALKGEKERCIEVGMNDFVPKPFMIEELLYVVRKLITEKEETVSQTPKEDTNNRLRNKVTSSHTEFGDEPLYDMSNVLMMEDNSFTLDILNTFLDTIPEGLQNLKEEISRAEDWEKVSKMAHKLKGGVGILQMNKMIEKLAFIEISAKKNENLGEFAGAIETCISIYNAVKDEIVKLRDEAERSVSNE